MEAIAPTETMHSKPHAPISVSDKSGIVDPARHLCDLGFRIVGTSGTAKLLTAADITLTTVSAVTGHPEILNGKVKTLHPAVYADILARRPDDMAELARIGYRNCSRPESDRTWRRSTLSGG